MPKIQILEKDETTPGVVSESTDVVYVPGFVDFDQNCLYATENGLVPESAEGRKTYTGITPRVPMLFSSVSDFESKCGKHPVKFSAYNKYTTLPAAFSDKSYMTGQSGDLVMFEYDPGYTYAKELLSAGLLVMFECMNERADINGTSKSIVTNTLIYPIKDANGDDTVTFAELMAEHGILAKASEYGFKIDAKDDITKYSDTSSFIEGSTYIMKTGTPGENDNPLKNGDTVLYFTKAENGTLTSADSEATEKVWLSAVAEQPASWYSTFADHVYLTGARTVTYTIYTTPYVAPVSTHIIYSIEEIPTDSPSYMYSTLPSVFSTGNVEGIIDRGNYSVKYITSGGYPVFEYDNNNLANAMMNFAENRGDCVAIIDHTKYPTRMLDPNQDASVYKAIQSAAFTNGDFGTMFTPWATYSRTTTDSSDEEGYKSETSFDAPASFAYLTSLADSIKTNANWLAVAGAARGKVLNLSTGGMLTLIPNGVADAMQPRSNATAVNAITNISPYGHTIWGNRTLKKNEHNLVATSFLNIRNLVSDVKKTCYRTARGLTFEQDTDVLWINFKSEISKLLDRMKSGYGISGYKIIRDNTHEKAPEKATLCAKVILYPTYAVEDFYITIVLKDDEVTVE